jgi:hypothetical protein
MYKKSIIFLNLILRDANATYFQINRMENQDLFGGWYCCFLDDGEGMSPSMFFVFYLFIK